MSNSLSEQAVGKLSIAILQRILIKCHTFLPFA